jgi:hypothetical protein
MAGKTKISDEDFLVAWQKFKSATQVANFFAKQSKVVEVAVKQTVAKPVTKAVAKTTPKKKAK